MIEHTSHFIVICSECGVVIYECGCTEPNKDERKMVCDDCEES